MFKPVLETKPLTSKRDVKVGDILRTYYADYAENLKIIEVSGNIGKGVFIKAEREFEGRSTGEVTLTLSRGYNVTWVRGYTRGDTKAVWQRTHCVEVGSHVVEMFYAEFGKGQMKATCWEITRDGEEAGYAVNSEDAIQNFNRVINGYIQNQETGTWSKAEI